MYNSLINLFHCQQRTQDDTIHALQVVHQSQRVHANDSLIHYIPTSDGKPEFFLMGF